MPTFYIEQFGCRATQADAAAIERQLRQRGVEPAPDASEANVVVVNTCTVTAAADAQARDAIRAIHRRNPAARIIVTGCYAQRAPEEVAVLPGVDWVVGNSHKTEIPNLLNALTSGRPLLQATAGFVPITALDVEPMSLAHGPVSGPRWGPPDPENRGSAKILTGDIFEQTRLHAAPTHAGETALDSIAPGHTRPVLKIQDGCNNRCAFCVIPFVRGRSRSLPPAEVLQELQRLVAAGAREIVLSGINLGAYGRDLAPRVEFIDLLKLILDETRVERLRISSIEPMDVTQDLIDLFAETDRMAQHFHIPLQSGSDRILAAMHRWYRAEHYERRVELIRERLPQAAIGADVIAGFPGETEEDHASTLAFIRRLPFTYLHVFSYSERPGTAAAKFAGGVTPDIVRRRARELRSLAAEKTAAFQCSQIGKSLRVLTLFDQGGDGSSPWTRSLSSHYLTVRVRGHGERNQFLDVQISGRVGSYLIGQAVRPAGRRFSSKP